MRLFFHLSVVAERCKSKKGRSVARLSSLMLVVHTQRTGAQGLCQRFQNLLPHTSGRGLITVQLVIRSMQTCSKSNSRFCTTTPNPSAELKLPSLAKTKRLSVKARASFTFPRSASSIEPARSTSPVKVPSVSKQFQTITPLKLQSFSVLLTVSIFNSVTIRLSKVTHLSNLGIIRLSALE